MREDAVTQWTPPEHRDPEWTDPDGTERGSGATVWLAVGLAVVGVIVLPLLYAWLIRIGG